ncbi:uncharacterized protein UDID_07218 [Ustilago sp. UG-2017a]|nr:uncharacterized protein UDID_07218 [Ustilago sp. UG-2017a]
MIVDVSDHYSAPLLPSSLHPRKEHAQSVKSVKEELTGPKNMLSSRQQKEYNTLKVLKDDLAQIKSEVDVLKLIKTKGADEEGLKKEEEEDGLRETVEEMEDFTRRLKEAFVGLAAPEKKEKERENEEILKEARGTKEGLKEVQGFMRQMQKAFMMLPTQGVQGGVRLDGATKAS